MKQILIAIVLGAQAVFAQVVQSEEAEPLRVMTFNIRYGTAPDGKDAWPHRKELVMSVIRDFNPALLGIQECLREQLDLILDEFPRYGSIGVGREDDGAGEYSPLLFDRARFDVLDAETFWLSDTPEVRASKSWGNEITRICTWARLIDRSTNRVVLVANTHWDHQSQPSRVKSGELIARRLFSTGKREPAILMGDFNVGPGGPARQSLVDAGLRDSLVDVYPEQAQLGTFHAFTGKATSDKIDAILVSRDWETLNAEIVMNSKDGRFPSDHFPVTATLKLNTSK